MTTFLATAFSILLSLGVAGPGATSASAERACDELVSPEQRERVKPPRKRKGVAPLTESELERWGPIRVTAVIDCEGRVVQVGIEKELPEEIEQKLRSNLSRWRDRPATLDGEPVAIPLQLLLTKGPPHRPGAGLCLTNHLEDRMLRLRHPMGLCIANESFVDWGVRTTPERQLFVVGPIVSPVVGARLHFGRYDVGRRARP